MIPRIQALLLLGTAVLVAGCSSQLPPAEQRQVNKDASLQDFVGSYRNGATEASRSKLWSTLPSGAGGRWAGDGWKRPGHGTDDAQDDRTVFLRANQADSRVMLGIEPNGDLRFRNRLKDGTEVGRGRIRAKDYRFKDGRIVIMDESEGHGPGPYYPGVAVTHKHFALALTTDRSLLVEEKNRFTGTTFVIVPMIRSNRKVTVYPRMD